MREVSQSIKTRDNPSNLCHPRSKKGNTKFLNEF